MWQWLKKKIQIHYADQGLVDFVMSVNIGTKPLPETMLTQIYASYGVTRPE